MTSNNPICFQYVAVRLWSLIVQWEKKMQFRGITGPQPRHLGVCINFKGAASWQWCSGPWPSRIRYHLTEGYNQILRPKGVAFIWTLPPKKPCSVCRFHKTILILHGMAPFSQIFILVWICVLPRLSECILLSFRYEYASPNSRPSEAG